MTYRRSFFCLKIGWHFQSSAFLCVSLSVFLAYLQYCGCKQTLPVCKNMNFFWSCYFFSIVWSYVRSKTSQLYHTAERMVLFKCWTCTLYSHSLPLNSRQNMDVVSQPFKLGWPLGFQVVLFGQVLKVLGHIPEGSGIKSKC